jgi:ABC-2 type transport system permease protein
MFKQLCKFELINQLRKPPIYIYFFAVLVFVAGSFATGAMPLMEKEHINAPYSIALWCAVMSMLISVPASLVMGMPLYRDIEFRTKEYYFAYPITATGYFWGRYVGAFLCMMIITTAVPTGIYLGSILGPLMGWRDLKQFGPNIASYYFYPWITITLPGVFFTSSLFFSLVALTRNVKVIYGGGILLFLSYFLAFFFLLNNHSGTVVELVDPFMINGVLLRTYNTNSQTLNHTLINLNGHLLSNRLLWTLTASALLFLARYKFSFTAYFRFKSTVVKADDIPIQFEGTAIPLFHRSFLPRDRYRIFFTLLKTELLNLTRDRYLWIILTSGMSFLLFAFCTGVSNYNVPDLPRTVLLYNIFNDTFPFYIFLFILFYTGEVLHRERSTRFAVIADTLPPGTWTYHGAKLCTLLLLGLSMAILPAVVALSVQIGKEFYQFHWVVYIVEVFVLQLPRLLEIVVFCYATHVLITDKFAAHGTAAVLWVSMFFLHRAGILSYNLLLYSYTPGGYEVSDMDALGHMLRPVILFHLYWLDVAGIFAILSALFYLRGTESSISKRIKQAYRRLTAAVLWLTVALIAVMLTMGSYIYYNVSYLNDYLTVKESENRQVRYEKVLKRYAGSPLPKVTNIRLFTDLYPSRQEAYTRARVTIYNRDTRPISQLLIDADELESLDIIHVDKPLSYSCPLYYDRGAFDWFRPEKEPAEFRLYHLDQPLLPGDSLELEVRSVTRYPGFANDLYAPSMLYNGTAFKSGLPSFGYDPAEELADPFERKKYHLPEKTDAIIQQNDPAGYNVLKAGPTAYLFKFSATISTDSDQTVAAPGTLQLHWQQNGRNYFHYDLSKSGTYMPLAIFSARYTQLQDTVLMDRPIGISIYYDPQHARNAGRFMAALKDGLHLYSKDFGPYPFSDIRLAETNIYQNTVSNYATLIGINENFGWNANFDRPDQFDYCYFRAARALAQQWWRFQVSPNNTIGSIIIPEGLSDYGALTLLENKYGAENMRDILRDHLNEYFFRRTRLEEKEHPLSTIDAPYLDGKTGVVLYGLRNLIGPDSVNAALRDFREAYAFKDSPPFVGNYDLYYYLQKHIPDSLQYYLEDNWQHITFYDNKLIQATAAPGKNPGEYIVTLTLDCAKTQIDENGNELPAKKMNDKIAIGIFSGNTLDQNGRWKTHPLFYQNLILTAGRHVLSIPVKAKPAFAGADPYALLIDRNVDDNLKTILY